MLFTFRYRTASLPDIIEDVYTTDADCLNSAVAEFKHFIRANYSVPIVVSYFYFVETSGSTSLGEFTESFYSKHFRSFSS